jgi:hypothetical protein
MSNDTNQQEVREMWERWMTREILPSMDQDFYAFVQSEIARAGRMPDDIVDAVEKALTRAWSLGQTYSYQADSEYTSLNRKADLTQEKFQQLRDETCALLSASPQPTRKERE